MIQAGRRTRPEKKLYYSRESNNYAGFPLALCASKDICASEDELPNVKSPIEVKGHSCTLVMEVAPTLQSFYWYLSTHPKSVIYWRWKITQIINLRSSYEPFTRKTRGDQLHQFCREAAGQMDGLSVKQLMWIILLEVGPFIHQLDEQVAKLAKRKGIDVDDIL